MKIDNKVLEELVRKVIAETLAETNPQPLRQVDAPSGVIAVRGATVKPEKFNTGKDGDQVFLKDVFSLPESPRLGSGIMEMKNGSAFDWTLKYDEIDYIIQGVLEIVIEGRKVTAQEGDILLIPKGSAITFSTPDYTRFMYVTYPANWFEQ